MRRSRDGTVLCDWKSRFGKARLPGDSRQCIGCSAEMGIPSPPMVLGRCRRSCTDALADLDILRFSKSLDPSTLLMPLALADYVIMIVAIRIAAQRFEPHSADQ
jgi:hypothetical protein